MVAYNGRLLSPVVEAAFGEDPDTTYTGYSWTDISDRVLNSTGVTITAGRGDWAGQASPTQVTFTLLNTDGDFTPDHPTGQYYPDVKRGLPIRVSLPYGASPPTERATVFVDSLTPGWDLSLQVPVVHVSASGRLKRLRQGDRLQSVIRRVMGSPTFGGTTAYWPLEDGSGTSLGAPEHIGTPMTSTADPAVQFGSRSDLDASESLPSMELGAALYGEIPTYADNGYWTVIWVMNIPTAPVSESLLMQAVSTGTAGNVRLSIVPGSPDALTLRVYDRSGTEVHTDSVAIDEGAFYGAWRMFVITANQNGSDIDYEATSYDANAGTGMSSTLNSYSHGRLIRVIPRGTVDDTAIGHVGVYTSSDFAPGFDEVTLAFTTLDANASETAYQRFQRLCEEEMVDWEIDGTSDLSLKMGPQRPGTLLEQFGEIEAADQSFIHDRGEGGALVLNQRSNRYNAGYALSLDVDAGELAPPFQPTYDDADIVNDSTVQRQGGSAARYVGDLSEGRYPESLTVNHFTDESLYSLAGWRVNLGTTPGMRYPRLSLNLRRSPGIAEDWVAVRLGDRIQVTNLPSEHGVFNVDVFVEGYTERFSRDTWTAELNCSPAAPYNIVEIEGTGDAEFRLDTGGSELASGVNSTATSLSVATTGLALWDTSDEPWGIEVGGERMTVTAVTGGSSPQTFTVTRSVNGVVKSHSAGAAVRLFRPYGLAL